MLDMKMVKGCSGVKGKHVDIRVVPECKQILEEELERLLAMKGMKADLKSSP